MKSVQARSQAKNQPSDRKTLETIRVIAREHGMSYRDAMVQYLRMETHY